MITIPHIELFIFDSAEKVRLMLTSFYSRIIFSFHIYRNPLNPYLNVSTLITSSQKSGWFFPFKVPLTFLIGAAFAGPPESFV
jgi:hypothetical protein